MFLIVAVLIYIPSNSAAASLVALLVKNLSAKM